MFIPMWLLLLCYFVFGSPLKDFCAVMDFIFGALGLAGKGAVAVSKVRMSHVVIGVMVCLIALIAIETISQSHTRSQHHTAATQENEITFGPAN